MVTTDGMMCVGVNNGETDCEREKTAHGSGCERIVGWLVSVFNETRVCNPGGILCSHALN